MRNSRPNAALAVSSNQGFAMAVNKPVGDNARKGAVRKRSELKIEGEAHWTKRNKGSGQFMAQKERIGQTLQGACARKGPVDLRGDHR